MEQNSVHRFPVIGIILVLLGAALLLQQMDIIQIGGWSLLWLGLLIYGAATVIRSFIINQRHNIFFGTLCYLTGLFFLLTKLGYISQRAVIYFPAFLVIFGLSFFMLFVFNIKDWHLLIPSFIFIGLGVALMMTQLGYWYTRDVWHAVASYWPLVLVLIGGTMILRRRNV
jgi:LiaF transmembrane domain/LiaI-LiaF-like transmembrane region